MKLVYSKRKIICTTTAENLNDALILLGAKVYPDKYSDLEIVEINNEKYYQQYLEVLPDTWVRRSLSGPLKKRQVSTNA